MQRVEHRPAREMLQNRRAFLISSVQVFKGSILIAEAGVNDRKVVRRDVTLLRQLVLLLEYLQRFITFACCGVGICQNGVAIPSLRLHIPSDNLLHLGNGFLRSSIVYQKSAIQAKNKGGVWIQFQGTFEFFLSTHPVPTKSLFHEPQQGVSLSQ